MIPRWQQLSQDLLSFVLNPNCALCGRSAEATLCHHCNRQLQQCQLSSPQFQGKGGISVLAWGNYGGLLKRAIAALKYEQQPHLARPLGTYLGKTWLNLSHRATTQPVVVPIPLHPAKQKQRGYNQAELIARSFCATTGLKLHPQGLKRIKNTEALFGFSPQQREAIIASAFQLGKGLKSGDRVLLLDDIYTTGTTVQTAQITLQQAGIAVIGVGAIATAKTQQQNAPTA